MPLNSPSTEPVLNIRDVSKTFEETRVLAHVSLTLRGGEIRALMGENGSGKSTLIKMLAGYHAPDPGVSVDFRGKPITFPMKPTEPRRLGLSFVHQDLGLVSDGSVVENLFVGQFRTGLAQRIRWRAERRRAREVLERFGMTHINPAQSITSLSGADRAAVAIVRAVNSLEERDSVDLADRAGLLVVDETTSFLADDGVARVIETLRRVAREGHAVLFVSHRLDEVFALCDSVTVLRDGRVALSGELGPVGRQDLVSAMVGGAPPVSPQRTAGADDTDPCGPEPIADGAFRARNLVCGPIGPLSFDLRPGEIVGVTGLTGSGFEALPYSLFGALPAQGEIEVGGRTVSLRGMRPSSAMRLGLGLVPADRTGQGGIGAASVVDNLTMLTLADINRFGVVPARAQRRRTRAAIRAFDIRPDRPDIEFRHLSGGNQQKVIIAKWSARVASVLLMHEPTRGVDIAAKQQILAAIQQLAAAGKSVLIASGDCGDLASVCDRVLITHRGRISRTLVRAEITEPAIQSAIHEESGRSSRRSATEDSMR